MISAKKLALIHVAKAKLGLDDETYRSLLQEVAGTQTSRDLDIASFERLLARFAEMGFQTPRAGRAYGRRRGMATPEQIEYIRGLWTQYTGQDDEPSLNHWLEHSYGITALRFADTKTAAKALTALKAMTSRKRPPQV